MFNSQHRDDLQRIVVLNPKGGCGKSTIATNLASYFALRGAMPTLVDCDPQGSSTHWLENRSKKHPPIHGIATYKTHMGATRTWQWRVPRETRHMIIDTPAALENLEVRDLIYDATHVIIPIMPSPIDVRYATRFIAELLLVTQMDREDIKIGIVANRTKKNTRSLAQLMRFLSSLRIPVVATLRDSQNYIEAASQGIGICDMPFHKTAQDIRQLSEIVAWLDQRPVRGNKSARRLPADASVISRPRCA